MSWSVVRFEELYAEPSKNGVYKPKEFHGSGVRIVNMGELFAYDMISNQEMSRLAMTESEMVRSGLADGDLLFGRRSLVESGAGKCSLVEGLSEPTTFESSLIRVRINKEKIRPRFLFYWFKSRQGRGAVRAIVTGTNVKGIRGSVLKNINVIYPPISLQDEIVGRLKTYDDLIENNRRRIQLLEQAARLLYKEWFVHLRFPGHEHVKIKDGVPEGWLIGKVSDLGEVITGKTPNTKDDSNYGGDVPFVKTPDMHGNSIVIKTEQMLSEKGANTQANKYLPECVILVACIGNKLGVVSLTSRKCQTNQQINAIIPAISIFRYYAFFALCDLKPRLEALGGGATMPNVNKTKFSSLPVLLADKKFLTAFDEFALPLFNQILVLQKQNEMLISARDLLLPRIMNGEIVV